MPDAKVREFLERLIDAGEDGIENSSLGTKEEHEFAGELIHDGNAAVRLPCRVENGQRVETGQRFIVAEYGAHEMLYVARGWARHTKDGLLITEEGQRHLKLALLTEDKM